MNTKVLLISFLCLFLTQLNAQDFVQIKNRWQKDGKTDYKIHIQNANVDAGATQSNWWSAQWTIEKIEGTEYYRIKNRWQKDGKTDYYLLDNKGELTAKGIEAGWWSAMWTLEKVGNENFYRIKNRWTGNYLHIQNPTLSCGKIEQNWWSAMWELEGFDINNTTSTSATNTPTIDKPVTFSILNYNTMLLDKTAIALAEGRDYLNTDRASKIPEVITKGNNWDVIIFNEAFDNNARGILIASIIAKGYLHISKLVNSNDLNKLEDGGVFIASKYPILKQDMMVYKATNGFEGTSAKGAIYVRIKKDGKFFNVFGTHLQSARETDDIAARKKQVVELKAFMDKQNIANSEAVIIGGDLNFDPTLDAVEYNTALRVLNSSFDYTPTNYTLDTKNNEMAKLRYEGHSSEFLDYILVQKSGLQPTSSTYKIHKFRLSTPLWIAGQRDFTGLTGTKVKDLSDHYGFSCIFSF